MPSVTDLLYGSPSNPLPTNTQQTFGNGSYTNPATTQTFNNGMYANWGRVPNYQDSRPSGGPDAPIPMSGTGNTGGIPNPMSRVAQPTVGGNPIAASGGNGGFNPSTLNLGNMQQFLNQLMGGSGGMYNNFTSPYKNLGGNGTYNPGIGWLSAYGSPQQNTVANQQGFNQPMQGVPNTMGANNTLANIQSLWQNALKFGGGGRSY